MQRRENDLNKKTFSKGCSAALQKPPNVFYRCTGSKGSFGNKSIQTKDANNLCNDKERTVRVVKLISSSSKVKLINSFNNKKSFKCKRNNGFSDGDEALKLNEERHAEANKGAVAEQMSSSLDLDNHISYSTSVLAEATNLDPVASGNLVLVGNSQ
jgi:hypothetical protein